MKLDHETFEIVSKLFKTPHNSVNYCGCWNNCIMFSFEYKDETGLRSGFIAHIDEDFNIKLVERIKAIWGKHSGQVITEFLPIHPEGNKTLLYSLLESEKAKGMKITTKEQYEK